MIGDDAEDSNAGAVWWQYDSIAVRLPNVDEHNSLHHSISDGCFYLDQEFNIQLEVIKRRENDH